MKFTVQGNSNMSPYMRWWLLGVAAFNIPLAWFLHNDPIGYLIAGLCVFVAMVA